MRVTNHPDANGLLGRPVGWDEASDGVCGQLPVKITPAGIESLWQPTEVELAQLNAGASVRLSLVGHMHPPVWLDVIENPNRVEIGDDERFYEALMLASVVTGVEMQHQHANFMAEWPDHLSFILGFKVQHNEITEQLLDVANATIRAQHPVIPSREIALADTDAAIRTITENLPNVVVVKAGSTDE